MFNSYEYAEGDTHIDQSPEKIEVTEKRAPTDESIKLSEEYFDKCLSKIIQSFRGKSNELRFGACTYEERHSGFQKILKVNFELNGVEYDVDVKFESLELIDEYEIYDHVFDKLSDAISEQLMEEFVAKETVKELTHE